MKNRYIFQFFVFWRFLFLAYEQNQLCKLDLAFALDNSGSISAQNFIDQKTFVDKFIQLLHPNVQGSHTSVMTFSTDAKIIWNMNDPESSNSDAGIEKLKTVEKLHQPYKCMEKVFSVARMEIFTKSSWRAGIKRILVLVSDGNGNCVNLETTNAEAQSLKAAGIKIITIGVGQNIDETHLKTLASKPEAYFSVASYDQLIETSLIIATKSCEISYGVKIQTYSSSSYTFKSSQTLVKIKTGGKIFYYGIIIENSNMMTSDNFQMFKTLPILIYDTMPFTALGSRLAVTFYSETPKLVVGFSDTASFTRSSLESAVNSVALSTSSKACSCLAYEKVLEEMFVNIPSIVKKVLIVAVSTSNNCGRVEKIPVLAEKIKQAGVVIFTISIGDNIDNDELILMSSGGSNVIKVERADSFVAYVHTLIKKSVAYYSTQTKTSSSSSFSSQMSIIKKIYQATDMVVIFENSARLLASEFQQIKFFLQGVVMSNTMSATVSRIAFVSYATTGKVLWDLESPNAIDSQRALKAISELQQSNDDQVCYEEGLEIVSNRIFTENSYRPNTPRFIIFAASNPSSCRGIEEIRKFASALKQRQITIMTVTYFGRTIETEITSMASSSYYYWEIYSESQISSVLNLMIVEIIKITSTQTVVLNPNEKPAKKNSVDLGFIITDTRTITDFEFRKLINTVIITVSQLEIGDYSSRVSVMINDRDPRLLWDFSSQTATNVDLIKNTLHTYKRTEHTTSCLDKALYAARMEMFNARFARIGVHKILILITSESTTCLEDGFLNENTVMLKNSGIYIAILAIGSTVDQNVLRKISTTNRFYFYYQTYGIYKLRLTQLIVYISRDEVGIEIEEEYSTTEAPLISTRPPPVLIKSACKIDLGIILDESLSITTHDFDASKRFILNLIRMLQPVKDQAHTSLMMMSNSGRMIYKFNDEEGASYESAHTIISEVEQLKGIATCYGNALRKAQYEMFAEENLRSDSHRALVIISDGGSECAVPEKQDYHSLAKDLKKRNIVIYTISFGGQKDESVMKSIATSPDHTYFSISDLGEFTNSVNNMVSQFCRGNVYPFQENDEEMHCNSRIAFLLDTSYSTFTEFQAISNGISQMIQYLFTRFNHDENKVTSSTSLVTYNEKITIKWSFNSFESKDYQSSHMKLVDIGNNAGMRSCLGDALQVAKDTLFASHSDFSLSTDTVFIVGRMTDDCNERDRIIKLTIALNKMNVNVVMVGVGDGSESSFYPELTTEKGYFYRINVATDFHDMSKYWVNFICRIPPNIRKFVTPLPTPPPGLTTTYPSPPSPDIPQFDEVDSCNTRTYILLDEGMISEEDFNDLRKSVEAILKDIMRRNNRDAGYISSLTALSIFSSSVTNLWDFSSEEARNVQLALQKFDSYVHKSSKFSCHDRSLKSVFKMFENSFPVKDTAYSVLFISSGENTCGTQQEAKLIARQIFNMNIYVIMITVGNGIRVQEVKDIAAAPNFYAERETYNNLFPLANYFAEMICRIPTTNIEWPDKTTTIVQTTPKPKIPEIKIVTPSPSEPEITTIPPFLPELEITSKTQEIPTPSLRIITPVPQPELTTTTQFIPEPITTPVRILSDPTTTTTLFTPSKTTKVPIIPPELTTSTSIIPPEPIPTPSPIITQKSTSTLQPIIPPEPITSPEIVTSAPEETPEPINEPTTTKESPLTPFKSKEKTTPIRPWRPTPPNPPKPPKPHQKPPITHTKRPPRPSPASTSQKPGPPIYPPIIPTIIVPIIPPPAIPSRKRIKIILKICKDLLVRPVGCLNSNYFQYFNHPLNKPLCRKAENCLIPLKTLKDTFCECSKRSRLLGQNSFALASNGQCFGNHFLHKISRGSILSNENCQRNDRSKCNDSDHTCLGSGNTLFVYSNA